MTHSLCNTINFVRLGQTASKTAKKNTGSSGGGGGGSGDGGGGGGIEVTPGHIIFAAGLAFLVSNAASQATNGRQGKEISWQEFSGQLLESGQVDRILISNKTTAR